MHMLIVAIVYADDEKDALEQGNMVFEGLVEHQDFDSYTTFDEAGADRGSSVVSVALADSDKGKELIEAAIDMTRGELFLHLDTVRDLLQKYSNDEIWEEKEGTDSAEICRLRVALHTAGAFSGDGCWLYDCEGSGMKSASDIEWALTGSTRKNHGDLKVYVVPADVRR